MYLLIGVAIMDLRVIRWPDLHKKVGLSRVQIFRLERDGKFPSRIQLGPNSVGWLESDVDAWIEGRARSGRE